MNEFIVVISLLAVSVAMTVRLVLARLRQVGELADLRSRIDALNLIVSDGGTRASAMKAAKQQPGLSSTPGHVPEVPDDLVTACVNQECVLFAGGGVAAQAGLPTWTEVLLAICTQLQRTNASRWSTLPALVSRDPEAAADLIDARMDRTELVALIERVVPPFSAQLPAFHRALGGLPFVGVVTNSWDTLLDRTFEARAPLRLEPEAEDFGAVLRNDRFFLLKLFGDVKRGPRITSEEYRRTIIENPMYHRFLASLFTTRTILFIGATTETIEDFLKNSDIQFSPNRYHFALVPRDETTELQLERLAARYNVVLLPFDPTPGFPEVLRFTRSLVDKVPRVSPPDMPRRRIKALSLQGVKLTNVGPFRELKLELGQHWNVLLGENGCGKSTILRAIALALAGDDDRAVPAAERLLRSGATSGAIELTIGGDTYRTEMVRDGRRVRVVPRQITPVQSGTCLALTFPALRGSSRTSSRGPSSPRPAQPGVEDVLPILTGTVDRRLDSLKQWVINTAWAEEQDGRERGGLHDTFFQLVDRATPGPRIAFSRIDRESWDVMMETVDGEVPLDFISQGMSSVLSWAGAVLQRLYEVNLDTRPEHGNALVLVDEIDAHLHPQWQRHIIPIIRKELPGLQVVATSHSPLIAGSLRAGELTRLYRSPGERDITCQRVDASYQGWSADEILTSLAFDLETTRDLETERSLRRYITLATADNLRPDDEDELKVLAAKLKLQPPAPKERRAARKAFETIQSAVEEQLRETPIEERERVEQEIRLQLLEAERGSSAAT